MQLEFMPIKQRCYEAMEQWEKAIEVYEEQLELEYTKALLFTKLDCATKQPKKIIMKRIRAFQEIFKRRPTVLSFDDGTERPLFGNGSMKEAYILLKKQLR